MPKKKNKHYKPQNHTDSKGIVSTYRNGYNQGLCDGQVIMADIIFIALHDVFGFGNSNPENLLDFVTILQEELIKAEVLPADYDFEAHKKLVPMQPGDVPVTYADTSALERDMGFKPNTPLREGLRKFAQWYKEFYK